MKNLILGLFIVVSFDGIACDNCNIYLNLSPNDYQNSIGIYFRQREMFGSYDYFGEMTATLHAGHGNDVAFWGQDVYETYQTFEMRGNFYFREKWKTTFILPFTHNEQRIGSVNRYSISGISDPTLLLSRQIFTTKADTAGNQFAHRLMIGLGLKFPLGRTDLSYENGVPNLDLQPGSGSWDGLAYLAYTAKFKVMGFNAIANIKRNGQDNNNYRYGLTTNSTLTLFADWEIKQTKLRFSLGGYLEHAMMDATYNDYYQHAEKHLDTGGSVYFANTGFQVFRPSFTIFGEYQHAVKSQLNGYTQLLTKNRINLGITYNF